MKRSSIALIELYGHQEVLRDCYDLLIDSADSIIIVTNLPIKTDLEMVGMVSEKIKWLIRPPDENINTFLRKQASFLASCDWVFLLTINRPFLPATDLSFLPQTVLLIHNSHTFLASFQHIYWSWRSWPEILLRQLRFLLSGDWVGLRLLLKRVRILAFPSENVRQYVIANNWISKDQLSMVLPLGYYKGIPTKATEAKERTTICIPGTIKSNGRDYETVYAAFRELLPVLDQRIHLCLLGLPKKKYGLRIQQLFQALALIHPHFTVQLYAKIIPQLEYDARLKEADFLILPFTAYSRYDGFKEKVGYSTISGGINDMIRFGIPALISGTYGTELRWEGLVAQYDRKEELEGFIKEWIKGRNYEPKIQAFKKHFAENFLSESHKLLEYLNSPN